MKIAIAVCAITSLLNSAMANAPALDETDPVWTAGGHYTAEIDLRQNTLTFLPLDSDLQFADIAIPLASCAQPMGLLEGVYGLELASDGFALRTTHPTSAFELAPDESYAVRACGDNADSQTLSLPQAALDLLSAKSVGSVYVRR
jgi:hypothetical protein